MKRNKIICPDCGQEISKSNFTRHQRRHKDHPETFEIPKYRITHEGLNCQFCGKTCKNRNSLCNHERQCRQNPNKQKIERVGFNNFGRIAWNKGLTKYSDPRMAQQAQRQSMSKKGKPGRKHTESEKQHLRECAIANGLGGFHMRKGIYYNGIKLDSSYEVTLAENLDHHGIRWERCSRFPYHMNDNLHYYTPDFYLPDYNVYLDPKNDFLIQSINPSLGYSDTDKIQQVMKENKIRIIILDKEHLCWEEVKKLL